MIVKGTVVNKTDLYVTIKDGKEITNVYNNAITAGGYNITDIKVGDHIEVECVLKPTRVLKVVKDGDYDINNGY